MQLLEDAKSFLGSLLLCPRHASPQDPAPSIQASRESRMSSDSAPTAATTAHKNVVLAEAG